MLPPPPLPDNGSRALRRFRKAWPIVVALVTGSVTTYGWLTSQLNAHITSVTDPRISAAVSSYDVTVKAWKEPQLQALTVLEHRLNRCDADLYELYWYYVGDKAAELELDPRRRAEEANEARDRFERYVKDSDGKISYEEAFRRSLRSRFPGR